jgi:hypothetical protein
MKNKKMENSVKSLVNLYTVVIGVALSAAVVGVIDVSAGLESATLVSSLLFIAFVATLFPFFHGALRHLDDAYIENDNEHIKEGALVIDFVLLFLHALAFVVLSLLIKKPAHFAWVLAALLTIDVVWGVFAHFASSTKGSLTAESKWTIINFIFVGFVVSFLVIRGISLNELPEPIKLAIPLAFICTLRTLVDYIWCKDFYFPK